MIQMMKLAVRFFLANWTFFIICEKKITPSEKLLEMKPERKKGKNRWHKAGRKITNGKIIKLMLKTGLPIGWDYGPIRTRYGIYLKLNWKCWVRYPKFIWVWNWILNARNELYQSVQFRDMELGVLLHASLKLGNINDLVVDCN